MNGGCAETFPCENIPDHRVNIHLYPVFQTFFNRTKSGLFLGHSNNVIASQDDKTRVR